jgi:lysozyme family protein
MNRNFERSLALVLKHEGGWADHPADPGGATMKGVTIGTYRRFINAKGTKADLRNITNAQLAKVYREQYWNAVRADELPDGLDYAVFDFAVNSGPGRAARYLQGVLGVVIDGQIGPATIKAAKSYRTSDIIENLCGDRMAFLQGLETWKTFGKGWSSRVAGVRKEALAMAGKPADAPKPQPKPQSPPAATQGGFWASVASFLLHLFKGGRK